MLLENNRTLDDKILHFENDLQLGDYVCAIGAFDGLHLGHRFILGEAISQAKSQALPSVAITFDRDPDELFKPVSAQRKLTSNADRIDLLSASGVDSVLVLPFDRQLAALSPHAFLEKILATHGAPRGIHVGADFRFGERAGGSVSDLRSWGKSHGCEVFGHELRTADSLPICSSRIREQIASGNINEANQLLGRAHFIRALVVKGRGEGRGLGFHTANLSLGEEFQRPADGVYFGVANVCDSLYKAAVSVGTPSTFKGVPASIEAHLLDFDGDLYGRSLQLFFVEYLREMQDFSSVDKLVEAVNTNIATIRSRDIPELL